MQAQQSRDVLKRLSQADARLKRLRLQIAEQRDSGTDSRRLAFLQAAYKVAVKCRALRASELIEAADLLENHNGKEKRADNPRAADRPTA